MTANGMPCRQAAFATSIWLTSRVSLARRTVRIRPSASRWARTSRNSAATSLARVCVCAGEWDIWDIRGFPGFPVNVREGDETSPPSSPIDEKSPGPVAVQLQFRVLCGLDLIRVSLAGPESPQDTHE